MAGVVQFGLGNCRGTILRFFIFKEGRARMLKSCSLEIEVVQCGGFPA